MDPFLIHCHGPHGDIYYNGGDGDVYLHVAYLPDAPREYTVFRFHITDEVGEYSKTISPLRDTSFAHETKNIGTDFFVENLIHRKSH